MRCNRVKNSSKEQENWCDVAAADSTARMLGTMMLAHNAPEQPSGESQRQKWLHCAPPCIICLIVKFEVQSCLPSDPARGSSCSRPMVVALTRDVVCNGHGQNLFLGVHAVLTVVCRDAENVLKLCITDKQTAIFERFAAVTMAMFRVGETFILQWDNSTNSMPISLESSDLFNCGLACSIGQAHKNFHRATWHHGNIAHF